MVKKRWYSVSGSASAWWGPWNDGYNGYNNGDIPMSHREARGLVGCSNKPITAAFRQLEETGFIHPTQKGSFDWKLSASGMSRSTRWTLAELPVNCPRETLTASKDFMKWRPVESAKKNHGVPTAYVTGALGTP